MQRDWEIFHREHMWVGMVREVVVKVEDEGSDENLLHLIPPATAGGVEIEGEARDDNTFDSTTRPPVGPSNQTPNSSTNTLLSNFPTVEEVRAAIPPGGIVFDRLVEQFRPRVALDRMPDLIALIHEAGVPQPGQEGVRTSSMRLVPRPVVTPPHARPAAQMQSPADFPTIDEVRAAIPPQGIGINAFDAQFSSRIRGQDREFYRLVRQVAEMDRGTRMLYPRQPTLLANGGPAAQMRTPTTFPTIDEIRAAIPPNGVDFHVLDAQFRSRVHPHRRNEFNALVMQVALHKFGTGRLIPRTLSPPPEPGSQAPHPTTFPTLDEIRAAVPPEGVDRNAFEARFRHRVPPHRINEFVALARQVALHDTNADRIIPINSATSPATRPGSQAPHATTFPTADEIRAIIPADGVDYNQFNHVLGTRFAPRVPADRVDEYRALVQQVAILQRKTNKVFRKDASLPPASTAAPQTPRPDNLPTADEIRAVIPREGVDDKTLNRIILRQFHSRIPANRLDEATALVRQVTRRRRSTGLLVPHPPTLPSTGPTVARTPRPDTFPTAAEIRAAISPEGVSIETLDAQFQPRLPNQRWLAFHVLLGLVSRIHSGLVFQRPAPPEPVSRETSFLQHTTNFPTVQEVQAAIPPRGIHVDMLLPHFIARVPVARADDFLALLEQSGDLDEETGQIMPKPPSGMPAGATAVSNPQSVTTFPTVEEVRAAIPPTGLDHETFQTLFLSRVPAGRIPEFADLLSPVIHFDNATGRFMPEPASTEPTGEADGAAAQTSRADTFPTVEEIRAAIPQAGIEDLDRLMEEFMPRVPPEREQEFDFLLGQAVRVEEGTGRIMRSSMTETPAGRTRPSFGFPTLHEIRAAIPPMGIPPDLLYARFRNEVPDARVPEFFDLVTRAGVTDTARGLIMPPHTTGQQHAGPLPPGPMQPPGLMPPPSLMHPPGLVQSHHPYQRDPSRVPSFMRWRKSKRKSKKSKGKERRDSTPEQYGFPDDWDDLNSSLTLSSRMRQYMSTRGGDMSTRRGGNENQESEELTVVLRDEDVFPPLPPPRPIIINLKPKDLAKMPNTP